MNKIKYLLVIMCFLTLILISGCNEVIIDDTPKVDNSKVEEVIDDIEVLPDEITKSDITQINAVWRKYNALTEEQKALVTNYDVLKQAMDKRDYLIDLDQKLLDEFDKIEAYLNELIPSSIEPLVTNIDLPSIYTYSDDVDTYNYRISYYISNTDVINGYGEVSHTINEETVNISISVKCVYSGLEKMYDKSVVVERNESIMFDHQILVAYWYGRYQELTDVDYESLDIINYSFAQIARKDDGTWYIDGNLNNISAFSKAKEKGIKICLSLGGWHDDSSFWDTYALAAKTEESRVAVANAILEVMIKYDLDGVDMDWEYPKNGDKTNFTLLMRQIKATLKAYNKDYLITAAIPAGSWITSRFDLKALNDELDLFYIMTYDLDDGMNCNHVSSLADAKDAVEFYSKNGVDKSKIVIGSAFYGRVYEGVADNGKGGLGVKASKKNEIKYTKIAENYLSRLGNGVTKYYDKDEEAYYLYDSENKHFVSYEGVEAVKEKWAYVRESGIGGLMYWDYKCDTSNTLMKAINEEQKNK